MLSSIEPTQMNMPEIIRGGTNIHIYPPFGQETLEELDNMKQARGLPNQEIIQQREGLVFDALFNQQPPYILNIIQAVSPHDSIPITSDFGAKLELETASHYLYITNPEETGWIHTEMKEARRNYRAQFEGPGSADSRIMPLPPDAYVFDLCMVPDHINRIITLDVTLFGIIEYSLSRHVNQSSKISRGPKQFRVLSPQNSNGLNCVWANAFWSAVDTLLQNLTLYFDMGGYETMISKHRIDERPMMMFVLTLPTKKGLILNNHPHNSPVQVHVAMPDTGRLEFA
jgi:hypothetical protein